MRFVLFLGDIMDTAKREKIMSLYEAIKTKLFETVYDPFDQTVLDPHNGHRVDVNQAVKRSLLGHNTCLVYDTDKSRQVKHSVLYGYHSYSCIVPTRL